MKIEHIGFNVREPVEMAKWLVTHLGMRIVRKHGPPTHAHFLAGDAGEMVEVYHNPKATVPDYAAASSLVMHLAFVVDDMQATRQRLVKAGATLEGDIAFNDEGDELAMVRDPWGFPVQLVKRAKPMV